MIARAWPQYTIRFQVAMLLGRLVSLDLGPVIVISRLELPMQSVPEAGLSLHELLFLVLPAVPSDVDGNAEQSKLGVPAIYLLVADARWLRP